MKTSDHVARLLIDGITVLPEVMAGRELQELQDAFERRAAERGKRWMEWDDIAEVPEFCRFIAHPRLMEVVDAFASYLGHEAVVANSSGTRDAYIPAKAVEFVPANLRHGPIGWHDDVMGMKTPNAAALQTCLASLLYLDETFADNGAFCSATGSHYLARSTDDGKPILADRDFVLDHCELRPIPVKPGTAVLYRAHHWHGVVPPRRRRRLVLQSFTAGAHYALQVGHTQWNEASRRLIPPERHRDLMSYPSVPEIVPKTSPEKS